MISTIAKTATFLFRPLVITYAFLSWFGIAQSNEIWGDISEAGIIDIFVRVFFSAPMGAFSSAIALPLWIYRFITDSPNFTEFTFNMIEIASLLLWFSILFVIFFLLIAYRVKNFDVKD